MESAKSLGVLILIFKFTEAVYICSYQSGICSISGQSVSGSDPFVLDRDNISSVSLMTISDGFMPQIPQTIFTNYPEIIFLSIANTSLLEISSNVFTNALKLTTLFLINGNLTTLNNGTFSRCVKLQNLQITSQQLSFIDILAFQGLKTLQSLALSENNLTFLHPIIFSGLPKLLNLNIEKNQITTIDSQQFVNNPWLYVVNVGKNNLKTIPDDLFQAQTSLSSFYANNNVLVSAQSFGASYVDVSNNKLRNFTISSGETTVHIENNLIRKIICSSTNITIQRLYADKNLLTNFLCIRDMESLTDLSVIDNKMVKPSKKAFLKLTKLRTFQMNNMSRFTSVPAKVFTPLTSLSTLRVDRLAAYKILNTTLPKLYTISLTTNTWNCTYLSSVSAILKSQNIMLLLNVPSDRARCQL